MNTKNKRKRELKICLVEKGRQYTLLQATQLLRIEAQN